MSSRWNKLFGKSAKIASNFYHNYPELTTKLINSDNPRRVIDRFYLKNEKKTIGELKDTNEELRREIRKYNFVSDEKEQIGGELG